MQCFRWSLRIQRSQHCREKRKCIAFLTAYLKCILVCLRIVKGMLLLLCSPALSRALLKRRSNSNNKSISISPVWDFALQHNLSHSACKLSWLLAGYLIKDLDRKSTLLAPFLFFWRLEKPPVYTSGNLKKRWRSVSLFIACNVRHTTTRPNLWCSEVGLDKELSPGDRRISSF